MPKLGLYHDADLILLASHSGALTRSPAGKLHVRLDNLTAIEPPSVTDDVTSGYEVGSTWLDVLGGNFYVCKDAAQGAAVWLATVQSPGVPGGSNTQLQFNNNGAFDGSSNLTWNGTALAVSGNVVPGAANTYMLGETLKSWLTAVVDRLDTSRAGSNKTVINMSSGGTYYGAIMVNPAGVSAGAWSLGYTTTTVNTYGTPVLTWTGGGNVGIGTATPASQLSLYTTTSPAAQVALEADSGNRKLTITPSVTPLFGGLIGMSTAHPLSFMTNNVNRMFIGSDGLIGIGTTSPYYVALTVASSSFRGQLEVHRALSNVNTTMGGMSFSGLDGSSNRVTFAQIDSVSGTSITAGAHEGKLIFYTSRAGSLTEAMGILANGYVGIGVTPTQMLDIEGSIKIGRSADGYGRLLLRQKSERSLPTTMIVGADDSGANTNEVNFGGGTAAGYCTKYVKFHAAADDTTSGSALRMGIVATGINVYVPMYVTSTSGPQFQVKYDGTYYADFTVSNAGKLTVTPSHSMFTVSARQTKIDSFCIGHSGTEYPSAGYNVTYSAPTASSYTYTVGDTASIIRYGCDSVGMDFLVAPVGVAGNAITFVRAGVISTDGKWGFGATSPSAKLHAISPSEQLRLGYDAANYFNATVGSGGSVDIATASGSSAGTINFYPANGNCYLRKGSINNTLFVMDYTSTSACTQTGGNGYQVIDGGNTIHNILRSSVVFNEQGWDLDFRVEGDNNAQVFFVDASTDRVGIGTSTPITLLQVVDGNQALGNWGNLSITTTNTQAMDKGGHLSLGGAYNSGGALACFADIVGRKENSTDGETGGYLAFATRNNTTGIAERMRIDSSGNVAIGTTTTTNAKFFVNGSIGTANAMYLGAGGYVQWTGANGYCTFSIWNGGSYVESVRFSLDSGVIKTGFGTGSPACLIHGISTTEQMRLGYDTGSWCSTTIANGGIATILASGAAPGFVFKPSANNTSAFVVADATGTAALTVDATNGRILARDGSYTYPSFGFASEAGLGFIRTAVGEVGFVSTSGYSAKFSYLSTTLCADEYIIVRSGAGIIDHKVYNGGVGGTNVLLTMSNVSSVRKVYFDCSVGVGTGSPISARLHSIDTTEPLRLGYDATAYVKFLVNSSGRLDITNVSGSAGAHIYLNPQSNYVYISGTSTARCVVMDAPGSQSWGEYSGDRWNLISGLATAHSVNVTTGVVFNEMGANLDFRIEGDTNVNMFVVDASADMIGIGTADPAAQLHILKATEQLRLGYNTSNYTSFTTNSGGDLTITPSGGNLTIATADVDLASDKAYYLGAPGTDGTWRIVRSGNHLLMQRREAGSYVTKTTITA